MKFQSHMRRFLSVLLVLSMLLGYLPVQLQTAAVETETETATEAEPQVDTFFDHITLFADGEETNFAELTADAHLNLTAVFDLGEDAITALTWQIYDPNGCQWVAITGADQPELQVGYAMVAGMLDSDGLALLNCKITSGASLYYSDAMQILMVSDAAPVTASLEETGEPQPQESENGGTTAAAAGDISGGELVTYTVTVQYTYLDGSVAAQPYSATVKANNTGLTVQPYSPSIVGYTPYVITVDGLYNGVPLTEGAHWRSGDETSPKAAEAYRTGDAAYYGVKMQNLSINLGAITEDVTYWIVYLPNRVSYTVSHYCQDVLSDEYVLFWVEVKEGYVGEKTQATDLTGKDLPTSCPTDLQTGFISLIPFEDLTIAADGTTQINTYYDRQYFLLTFKLDGGRETEPVYARYGAPITVTDPVRSGYKFVGWYRLEMERVNGQVQPRPRSENGEYFPVYTNEKGQLLAEDGKTVLSAAGGVFVNLVQGSDGYYYVPNSDNTPSDIRCEPMQSSALPTTMQYFHAAMLAVWEEVDTNVTVVYWLEKADYRYDECDEPHLSHEDNLKDGDADFSDYAYWCSTTLSYQSGTNLKDYIDKLENPLATGTGAAQIAVSQYEQFIPSSQTDLNEKELVIVNTRGNQEIIDTVLSVENQNGLGKGSFSPTTKTVEWKFLLQDDGTFVLKSGDAYMAMDANGYMTLETTISDNTKFTVGINTDGTIYLYRPSKYVNCWGGIYGAGFRGYGSLDGGSYFRLYISKTEMVDDPEFNYYYYYYSDLKGLNGQTYDITVDPSGTTIVNVYYRRREYNLRFFYGRSSKTDEVDSEGNPVLKYEVVGGTINPFSTENNDTTEGLLESIPQNQWGVVTEPSFDNAAGYYTKDSFTDKEDVYTYYYFVFTARYGQNIADEWPSDVVSNVTRQDTTVSNGWNSRTAVFSAWGGEFWLKYSVDQRNSTKNYTIKGNYQVLDENLLYDASYTGDDPYYLRGTVIEYANGPMTRYLDFIAFYENGVSGVDWNVPKQYHYYLWTEASDQTAEGIAKAVAEAEINGYTVYSNTSLPHSQQDFESVTEGKTLALISGTLYVLYNKIDTCDNDPNPCDQTIVGIPGYYYNGSGLGEKEGSYTDYDSAIKSGIFYYMNYAYLDEEQKIDGWDKDVYQYSYSLNFSYSAELRTITLQNYDHTRDLTGIPYNSSLGANWIKGYYAQTPEVVEKKCPQGECPAGFTTEQMMNVYYPSELPEGAYVFAGWYKSPEFIPGTEANLDTGMPNYNIILYAKWVPKVFDVEVFQTSDRDALVHYPDTDGDKKNEPMQSIAKGYDATQENLNYAGQGLQVPLITGLATDGKPYGSYLPDSVKASGPDTTVENGAAKIPENMSGLDVSGGTGQIRTRWIFVCWAYMEDGVEHAIDVGSYQVHDNVQIYAKWTATTIVDYRVEYQLANLEAKLLEGKTVLYDRDNGRPVQFGDDGKLYYLDDAGNMTAEVWQLKAQTDTDGNPISIADPITGMQNEGANRTFTAKTGVELYTPYQSGYFPLTTSHTLLMEYVDACYCTDCACVCVDTEGGACTCGENCACPGCAPCDCRVDGVCQCEEGQCQCEPCTDRTCVTLGKTEGYPLTTVFYYIQVESVPYSVYYLDANGQPIFDLNGDGAYNAQDFAQRENTINSEGGIKMVVTESYLQHTDYTPDALQKTLILSANPAENRIVFHYTASAGAPYQVVHYIQTLSSDYDVYDDATGKYYKLYYSLDGQLIKQKQDDGTLKLPDSFDVAFYTIPGFEYVRDEITRYSTVDQNNGEVEATRHELEIRNVAEATLLASLTDALGCKATRIYEEDHKLVVDCAGDTHEDHVVDKNLFYYTDNGVQYEVRSIVKNTDGTYTLTVYDPQSGMKVENPGAYGTLVKVYYDMKYYPYFIYHKLNSTNETLLTIMGKAQYQDKVEANSWTETELINRGLPGFTMDNDNKTITMTMTMTIRDTESNDEQKVNILTFYYYEKSIEYTYQPVVLLNPGADPEKWETQKLTDSNAQVSLPGQPVDANTGTASACEPYYNSDAYEFVGWFLDADCKYPVVADERMYSYMGAGQRVELDATSNEAYIQALANYTTIQPKKYKGNAYAYSELAGIDADGNKTYVRREADLTTIKDTNGKLIDGVYVGAYALDGKVEPEVFTNQQTFYALFVPKLGQITITRDNLGANTGLNGDQYNQANSFVYQLQQTHDASGQKVTDGITMYVTIDPQDFVNGSASVTITNLPFGTYTVTQVADWSWRYGDDEVANLTLTSNAPFLPAKFSEEMQQKNWLSGFAQALENIYGNMKN